MEFLKLPNEAVKPKGLRDDTTCIVVDILPQEKPAALPPPKKPVKGMLKAMFRKKNSGSSSQDKDYMEPDVVEELFEEGSAWLSELSTAGGRMIISSDGVWDALTAEEALDCCRGMPPDAAAAQIVKLDTKYPLCNMFKLFMCAVCQLEMKPGEGISIHVGTSNPVKLRPWDGPFLCSSCNEKKEAMEGKRPSGNRHGSDSD
ncbi:hypothetical protein GOBAR_AA38613 [Gossypium barbadense]|uniref:PPM-type phosphatase domain-containing protein n=1 Tax=Gossypium barbadense TaxID=3634 RepID=A0A2P5VTC7_GOSBA|nr:hypothetical protein GOBAR_AA38613 [Gossypium barbadense]